jgi:hypothetical protein
MTTETQTTPAPPPTAQPAPRARAAARRRGLTLDPTAKFGPVSGAVAYGLGALASAAVAEAANAPAWVALIAAGILGIGAVVRAHFARHTFEAKFARWVAWVAAGIWVFAVVHFSHPWNLAGLIVLTGMSYTGGQLAFIAKRKRDKAALEAIAAAQRAAAAELEGTDARAREWRERIKRVCNIDGVQILAVEDWPDGSGYTIEGVCPAGGSSWEDIDRSRVGLGADKRLPGGCLVQVMEGVDQGTFLIDVPTKDAFAEEQAPDLDITPRSILHGLDLGVLRNTGRGKIPIREESVAVVGTAGAGKTTLLHRFVKQIACCTDGMLGVADMNEGDIGRAWTEAWWDGKAPYPVVSWVAWDAREAYILAVFSLGVAKGRKRRSGPLKRAANDSLMPIGNGTAGQPPPWWGLLWDESAELIGGDASRGQVDGLNPDEVKELIRNFMATMASIARLARDAGVRHILSALRAVDGFIDPDLLGLTAVRVGMRMDNDRDPGYLFGWEKGGTNMKNLRKGSGRFALGYGQTTQPFMSPNMLPNDIYELSIAIAKAGIGPWELQPEDITAGETEVEKTIGLKHAWRDRWIRAEPALFGRPRIDYDTQRPVITKVSDPSAIVPTAAVPKEDAMKEHLNADSLTGALADLKAAAADLEAECQAAEAKRADEEDSDDTTDLDARWPDVVAGLHWDGDRLLDDSDAVAPSTEQPKPPADWRAVTIEILRGVGERGAGPNWIAGKLREQYGFATSRQTVSEWLNSADRPDCIESTGRLGRWRYRANPAD